MRSVIWILLLALLPSWAGAQSIDKAYQKEFVYLQGQKSALEKRLSQLQRDGASTASNERATVNALQAQLVSLQLEGDALQAQLADVERDAIRVDETSESLLSVFEQAKASLERYGVEVEVPDEAGANEVSRLFEAAIPVLNEAGEVVTKPGAFFLQDGRQIDGQITYHGRIAAFGESPAGSGALAPAGDGHLKMWPAETGGVFLFENVEKAVSPKTEMTWLDMINAGGIIAWVIVGLGILALILIVFRLFALALATSRRLDLDSVCKLVAVGRYTEARRELEAVSGATARVALRAVEVVEEDRNVADDAIAQAILTEQPALERFGTAIMVFAAVAPLLGLLGTVTGMIATFDIITEFGTGDPQMLSSGISEALITTQFGLMVAIPALLIGNLLNAHAASMMDSFEQAALRIFNSSRLEETNSTPRPGPSLAAGDYPEESMA